MAAEKCLDSDKILTNLSYPGWIRERRDIYSVIKPVIFLKKQNRPRSGGSIRRDEAGYCRARTLFRTS